MRNVAVAFNDDVHLKSHLNDTERTGEVEVVATALEIAELTGGRLLPVREVKSALNALRSNPPEVVFNLCEGVEGRPDWEMHFGLALEMLGIAFTGADPTAVGICNDKGLTRRLLATAGLAVPRGFVLENVTSADWKREAGAAGVTAWIVKPLREDAGIGIEPASVCSSAAEIGRRVEQVIATYRQPALVEEFIDGRELNQALYFSRRGPVVLPAGEILFADNLSWNERIVGWKAKWAEGSDEDRSTVNRTPAELAVPVRRDLEELCLAAADVLSIGGYCRFDVRQRKSGELCLIDVNPNPDIGRGSGFRKALQTAGIAFGDFVTELMMAALSRNRP